MTHKVVCFYLPMPRRRSGARALPPWSSALWRPGGQAAWQDTDGSCRACLMRAPAGRAAVAGGCRLIACRLCACTANTRTYVRVAGLSPQPECAGTRGSTTDVACRSSVERSEVRLPPLACCWQTRCLILRLQQLAMLYTVHAIPTSRAFLLSLLFFAGMPWDAGAPTASCGLHSINWW